MELSKQLHSDLLNATDQVVLKMITNFKNREYGNSFLSVASFAFKKEEKEYLYYEVLCMLHNSMLINLKYKGLVSYLDVLSKLVDEYVQDQQAWLEKKNGSLPNYYDYFIKRNEFYSVHEELMTPNGDDGLLFSSSQMLSKIFFNDYNYFLQIYNDLIIYNKGLELIIDNTLSRKK